ncbi:LLM class F420-dependent oxidoreductase [Pseudonocardia xishanensis]|uniref:LLM class F420-dependent oxidoreductase n=1 Tax=Pseudonocardia xishanensis TaxID=630995 RepID=UPI0031E4E951
MLPTQEIGSDPIAIRDFAQAVEELGFDHLVAYDHVLGAVHEGREPPLAGPYDEQDPFHEPFVLFGYLAALTRRIELATGVLVLPQRQTALVAKQATEISLLSGGRLRLGVGTGWNYVEYSSLGTEFAQRASVLTEQIEVLRALWRDPVVDFQGKHHRIDRAGLLPRPESDIPLWCGGSSLPAVRRGARMADGFMFGSTRPVVFELAPRALELVDQAGRDPRQFGLEAVIDYTAGEAEWERALADWEKVGGTHFSFRTISTAADWMRIEAPGFTSPTEHITALERFARKCL